MTIRTTWHNLDRSPAVETAIEKHYEKLLTFSQQITSAHLFIDQPNSSNGTVRGGIPCFEVVLELHVPGDRLVVSHSPSDLAVRQDLYALLHHTFDAARRQLQDYVRKRQGKVKRHRNAGAQDLTDPTMAADKIEPGETN